MKKIFFHYGPGGNAQVEQKWLGPYHPSILFMDIPETSASMNFESMLQAYLDFFDQEVDGEVEIVAHSFGCDLALELAKQRPEKVSQINLLSPVRDLPTAFYNLGVELAQSVSVSQNYKDSLEKLKTSLNTGNHLVASFWEFVGEATQKPEFFTLNWFSQENFKKYFQLASESKPVAMDVWQTVVNDYISHPRRVFDSLESLSDKTHVILGSQDKYYQLDVEKQFWLNVVGEKQLKVVANCGHYPQFEASVLQ